MLQAAAANVLDRLCGCGSWHEYSEIDELGEPRDLGVQSAADTVQATRSFLFYMSFGQ